MRDALGALGPVDGQNPELNNLTCSLTYCDPGDIVFLTSDGISDNFDPVVGKFAIPRKEKEVKSAPKEGQNSSRPSSGREQQNGTPEQQQQQQHESRSSSGRESARSSSSGHSSSSKRNGDSQQQQQQPGRMHHQRHHQHSQQQQLQQQQRSRSRRNQQGVPTREPLNSQSRGAKQVST